MSLSAWTRRLDDRVIGAAERDPHKRRRAEVWGRGALLTAALVLLGAAYIGSNTSHLPVAVVFGLVGLVIAGQWTHRRKDHDRK